MWTQTHTGSQVSHLRSCWTIPNIPENESNIFQSLVQYKVKFLFYTCSDLFNPNDNQIRTDEKRNLKILFFNGSSFTESLDDWDVIMELRKAIYCTENLIPMELEFDETQEKISRHLICYGKLKLCRDCRFLEHYASSIPLWWWFICPAVRRGELFCHCIKHSFSPHSLLCDWLVGDAPVATARYRVLTAPDNVSYTEIDRLGILPHYRGRKLSRKVMLEILSDSQEVSRSPISVILLSIPGESWIKSKLESIGWSVNLGSSMEQRGPRMFFQMIFHATPSWIKWHRFISLINFKSVDTRCFKVISSCISVW